jgi:hypothetical protein
MPRELCGHDYQRDWNGGGSGAMSAGYRSGRALLAFRRLVLRPTVMPRFWYGVMGRSGDENWVGHIGEHNAVGPGRLWVAMDARGWPPVRAGICGACDHSDLMLAAENARSTSIMLSFTR